MPARRRAGGVLVFKTHGSQLCLCLVSFCWGRGGESTPGRFSQTGSLELGIGCR